MARKILVWQFALLGLALLVSATTQKRRITITLVDDTAVAGTTLKPGDYEVEVDGTVATFYLDGKEVVRASVHERQGTRKFLENGYIDSGHTLTQLHLGGTNRIVFIDGPASKSS